MSVSEEEPGSGYLVAIIPGPVTPADLAALAAQLPAETYCTDVEIDEDDGTLYAGFWTW